MSALSIRHVYLRTAEAFGLDAKSIRLDSPAADDARQAFVWLASSLCGAGSMAPALSLGLSVREVLLLYREASQRISHDGPFLRKVQGIELECAVETGVAAQKAYPLPQDRNPTDTAWALISSPREAMRASLNDLDALGAAYISLDNEVSSLRDQSATAAPEPAPDALASAVKEFLIALDLWEGALHSPAEKAARMARNKAIKNLKDCFAEKDAHDVRT